MKDIKYLNEVIPIYSIEEKKDYSFLIGKDNSITIGFECINGRYALESDKYFEDINNSTMESYRKLGENIYIHKQDIFFYDKNKNIVIDEKDNNIIRSMKKNFQKEYLCNKSFLWITKKINANQIENFLNEINIFLNTFPLDLKPINKDRYEKYIKTLFSLNFNFNEMEENYNLQDIDFVNSRVGDKYMSIFSLDGIKSPTNYCVENQKRNYSSIESLTYNIPCEHIVNNIIYIPNKKNITEKLKKNRKYKKYLMNDTYHLENYLELIHDESVIPAYHHFNIIALSKNEEDKQKINNLIQKSFLKDLEQDCNYIIVDNDATFINSIGGGASLLYSIPNKYYLGLLNISIFFQNYEGEWKQMEDGMMFADIKGTPLIVNPYKDLDGKYISNFNSVLFGSSGTGKSFTENYLLLQYLNIGHRVVIFDIGSSYRKLCNVLNGEYHEMSSKMSFNLFKTGKEILLDDSEEKHENFLNFKDFLCDFVFLLWEKKASAEEKSIILNIINSFYEEHGMSENIGFDMFYSFIEEKKNLHINKYIDFDSFFLVTKKYFRGGEYETLLNGSFIDKKNPFIVFEFDKIKDNERLMKLFIPIIISFFNSIILDQRNREKYPITHLVLDECWKFLKNENIQPFIEYCYRTFRKLGGGIKIITQSISDIANSELGKIIIGNSSLFMHLSPELVPSSIEDNKQFVGLTNYQSKLLLSIKINERLLFIKQGDTCNLYKIVPSKHMKYLFSTTAQEEGAKINTAIKNTEGNIMLAIENLVEEEELQEYFENENSNKN